MKLQNEKGSITIFVLIGLLFMSAFLIISYASNVNRSKVVDEQSKIINDIYAYSDENEEIYLRIYGKLKEGNQQILTKTVENSNEIELSNSALSKITDYKIYGEGLGEKASNLLINPYEQEAVTKYGVTFEVLDDYSIKATGTQTLNLFSFVLFEKEISKVQEQLEIGQTYYLKSFNEDTNTENFYYYLIIKVNRSGTAYYFSSYSNNGKFTWLEGDSLEYISVRIYSEDNVLRDVDTIFRPMITKDSLPEDYDIYGKYKIPLKISNEEGKSKTVNIIISEPLKEGDCIDFKQGKLIKNDGTEQELNLPELSTFEDYTKIEVLTTETPSKIEVEYLGYSIE